MYDCMLTYTFMQVIAFEILYRTNVLERMEGHSSSMIYTRSVFGVLAVLLFLVIMWINSWFWGWEYFGGIG